MVEDVQGVWLRRTAENVAGIDALAGLLGGRAGMDAVLADLDRQGRRSWAPGRAAHRAFTWDREDRRTARWWPQGISTSADAADTEQVGGRDMLAVTWYAKDLADGHHGSRVTFMDLATRRYRHVLLVLPTMLEDGTVQVEPLRVHAGGVVWCGPYLHIAATSKGFVTCRVDDILHVPKDRVSQDAERLGVDGARFSAYGYRYLLPVCFSHRAHAEDGHPGLKYSFLALDRQSSPPELVAGEYATGTQPRRLARFRLDPESLLPTTGEDGFARPVMLHEGGVVQTQGAVTAKGSYYLTVSHGTVVPGSVYVGEPGAFRRHRWAAPMGPEDIAYWPSTDLLWSLTEHPRRRWVFSMRRRWFDR